MVEKSEKWVVYILKCGDGSLYTGITNDFDKRLKAHRAGKGAKFTKGRGPLKVVYLDEQPDRSQALKTEWAIKKLSRQEKLVLVQP
ncbi:MAG: endonuclease [Myxococcales bacterium]|nr:endonuclease [Myxococcales bacterium]|tara:strand:+ start:3387 stop:3644 length:258 start_codon:yes stop_codon:yes gene_type:complete